MAPGEHSHVKPHKPDQIRAQEKLERERLRAEIARDKAERRARGGKLGSVLGVDGYAPSCAGTAPAAVIYDGVEESKGPDPDAPPAPAPTPAPAPAAAAAPPPPPKLDPATAIRSVTVDHALPIEVVDEAIANLAKYTARGELGERDGDVAMKTLGMYIANLIAKPDEPKFRTINGTNAKFGARVASLLGGVALLLAVGFEVNAEGKFVLAEEKHKANLALLKAAHKRLAAARQTYLIAFA